MAHDLVARYRASKAYHNDNVLSFTSYCGGCRRNRTPSATSSAGPPAGVLKALRSPSRSLRHFTELRVARPWDAISRYDAPLPCRKASRSIRTATAIRSSRSTGSKSTGRCATRARHDPAERLGRCLGARSSAKSRELEGKPLAEINAALEARAAALLKDNSYAPGEPDRVVLFVSLRAERDGKPVYHETWAMDAWGDVRGTAMGRLVSVPVSLAHRGGPVARDFRPASTGRRTTPDCLRGGWIRSATWPRSCSGSTIWPERLRRPAASGCVAGDRDPRPALSSGARPGRTGQAERQDVGSTGSTSGRLDRLADRLAVLAARRARPAGGFVSQPEPRSIGLYTRGKQLLAGNILLAGHLAEAPGTPDLGYCRPRPGLHRRGAQGFAWLDDLAALGTSRPSGWRRTGPGPGSPASAGPGPGWTPDLTGRRIIRWVHHATLLLNGRDKAETEAFYAALARQAAYLARRWSGAAGGLPRFEALSGLVYAGISLIGMEALVAPATRALADACRIDIDTEGGIPTRNPKNCLRC